MPRKLVDYDVLVSNIADRAGTTIDAVWAYFSFSGRLPHEVQTAISMTVIELGLGDGRSRAARTLMRLADERHEHT